MACRDVCKDGFGLFHIADAGIHSTAYVYNELTNERMTE